MVETPPPFPPFFLGIYYQGRSIATAVPGYGPGILGDPGWFFLGKDFGFLRDYISHGTYFLGGINRKLMQIYNNFDGFPENNNSALFGLVI